MHMPGNKALVLRAEIFAKDLYELYRSLSVIDVNITPQNLPQEETL
jgi:hypothetical protein